MSIHIHNDFKIRMDDFCMWYVNVIKLIHDYNVTQYIIMKHNNHEAYSLYVEIDVFEYGAKYLVVWKVTNQSLHNSLGCNNYDYGFHNNY